MTYFYVQRMDVNVKSEEVEVEVWRDGKVNNVIILELDMSCPAPRCRRLRS